MMRTRQSLISTALILAASCLLARATTAQQPKAQAKKRAAAKVAKAGKPVIRLLNLSVSKPAPAADPEAPKEAPAADSGGFVAFGAGATTSMGLRVDLPGRNVIGLDVSASRVTEFADDKGTDLLKTGHDGPVPFGRSTISQRPRFEPDPHGMTIDIFSRQAPTPGALKITVKADLVVLCAGGEKSAEQRDVALKPGTEIAAGSLSCTILKAVAEELGESKFWIELKSGRSFDETAKEISFIDPAGKSLKAVVISGFSSHADGVESFSRTYALDRKVDKVTVRVVCFDKVRRIHVPVELNTGIGF